MIARVNLMVIGSFHSNVIIIIFCSIYVCVQNKGCSYAVEKDYITLCNIAG